jgi:hypothetical protein
MLIVNDAHLCLAGRSSLEERCHYCKKPSFCVSACHERRCNADRVACHLRARTRHRPPGRSGDLLSSSNPVSTIVCSHASRRRFCHNGMRRAGANGRRYPCRKPTFVRGRQPFEIRHSTSRASVSCAIGVVVAVRHSRGQLLALIRGWGGRWYSVDSVYIVYAGRTLLS